MYLSHVCKYSYCQMVGWKKQIGAARFGRNRDVVSLKLVFLVAVVYLILCHAPVIGPVLSKTTFGVSGAYADSVVAHPVGLTTPQCMMVRDEFVHIFMDEDSGIVVDCNSSVVALVWNQMVSRQYGVNSFDDLRNTTDANIAKILMRAALGSYVDTTDPTRSFANIRADAYAGRVTRVPSDADVKVGILEVTLVAALLAVWQSWWASTQVVHNTV